MRHRVHNLRFFFLFTLAALCFGCAEFSARDLIPRPSPPSEELPREAEGSKREPSLTPLPATQDFVEEILSYAKIQLPSGFYEGSLERGEPCSVNVSHQSNPALTWTVQLEYGSSLNQEPGFLEFVLFSSENLFATLQVSPPSRDRRVVPRLDVTLWEVEWQQTEDRTPSLELKNERQISIGGRLPQAGSSVYIYDRKLSEERRISHITCHF